MIHRKITTILLISILPGCSLGHLDQPPGPIHEVYVKKGADELEVKKALMECGYPAPYYVTWQDYGLTDNEVIMYTKCMENPVSRPWNTPPVGLSAIHSGRRTCLLVNRMRLFPPAVFREE